MPQQPNNFRNQEQERRILVLEEHIGIVNHELGEIKTTVAYIKSDVCWIKKTYWVVCTATIGSLVVALFNLLGK